MWECSFQREGSASAHISKHHEQNSLWGSYYHLIVSNINVIRRDETNTIIQDLNPKRYLINRAMKGWTSDLRTVSLTKGLEVQYHTEPEMASIAGDICIDFDE